MREGMKRRREGREGRVRGSGNERRNEEEEEGGKGRIGESES